MSNAYTPEPMPHYKEGERIVLEKVMEDLRKRAEVGKKKYGDYLRTRDGRNTLIDAYQEALDLAMYLAKAIMEADNE